MLKKVSVLLLSMGISGQVNAGGSDLLAKFEGGIGVIPALNGAGPLNQDGTLPNVKLNIVRDISPAGGPWTIDNLRAEVDETGRIKVRGRGLLLAGGNSIGQNGNVSVFATLICEPTGQFVPRNTTTTGVPLEPNGDFRIDDTLNPAPTDCQSPVLLIRNAGNGTWLAAGIPQFGDD